MLVTSVPKLIWLVSLKTGKRREVGGVAWVTTLIFVLWLLKILFFLFRIICREKKILVTSHCSPFIFLLPICLFPSFHIYLRLGWKFGHPRFVHGLDNGVVDHLLLCVMDDIKMKFLISIWFLFVPLIVLFSFHMACTPLEQRHIWFFWDYKKNNSEK